jgi:SEC-C motif domain protein
MSIKSPLCPCGSQQAYDQCCGRFHRGAIAANAELLMRSRYSAYALAEVDYLLATWHPDTRPATLDRAQLAATRWLGLTVKSHRVIDAEHAQVEFVARSRVAGGSASRLHEISQFVRKNGRWYYVDGRFPA